MFHSEFDRTKYLGALSENHLLKDLDPQKLNTFLGDLKLEVWPRNTCSLNRPLIGRHFHFILSGRMKLYKYDPRTGREFTLFLLGKNDAFDILNLFDGIEHQVFYEALERVYLLSTPMPRMRFWIQEFPELNRNLIPYLSLQIRTLEEYASNITLIDIQARLARLILSHHNPETGEVEMIRDLTHDEIAKLIGSTRAVINRHLQVFKNSGILKFHRHKIEIIDKALLREKAGLSKKDENLTRGDT